MKKLLFISVLILSMIFSCKEDTVTEPEKYEITISGKIVDQDENAIENCSVTLITENDSLSSLTEIDGTFSFLIITTGLDSANLIIKKNNYEEQTHLIKDLTKDDIQDLTIVLLRSYVTISGTLTELNEDGVHPSENAIIRLSTVCASSDFPYLYDTTDQNGNFLFKINYPQDCLKRLWLKATKPGYGITEIELDDSIKTNISLQISKIVNYFPLKAGNKWEYYVLKDTSLTDYYSYKYEGTERWEIISVSSDGKTFTLDKYFTGTLKSYFQLGLTGTEHFEDYKTTYNLKYENGVILSAIAEGEVPFGLKGIVFLHPISNDGLYSYYFNIGHYNLEYGKGIVEYEHEKDLGWANMFNIQKLKLIKFAEGG